MMLNIEYRYFPSSINTWLNVILIGAGGTGSLFLRDFLRYVKSNNSIKECDITVIDGDHVEEKNLVRQNFIRSDIGKNKAEVLAMRYSAAFEYPISFVNRYVDESMLSSLLRTSKHNIIISFVDNVKTRLVIYKTLVEFPYPGIWIDCGNMKYNGQVCISEGNSQLTNRTCADLLKLVKNLVEQGKSENEMIEIVKSVSYDKVPLDTSLDRLRTVIELHKDLLDPKNLDKSPDELSCAEVSVSYPQTMAANLTAANLAFNAIVNILEEKKINYNEVYFDVQNNSFRTVFLDDNYKFITVEEFIRCYYKTLKLLRGDFSD